MVRSACFVIAVLASPTAGWGQSDVAWRYTAPDNISFTHIDAAGNVLVGMKRQVVALHADSGKPIWSLRFDSDAQVFRNVLDAYFLFGYGHTLMALDPVTGDTVWHRANLPDLEHSIFFTPRNLTTGLLQTRDGFAALDLPSGRTLWDSLSLPPQTVVREYFPVREHDLLVLLARTPRSDIALLGVTLDSGHVLWQHDSLFQSKLTFRRDRGVEYLTDIQVPRPLADSTLLIYFSSDGPLRLDPRSGLVRWRAIGLAGKPVGGWQEGYPAPSLLDSMVLVASQRAVVALDTATGAVRWRSDAEREFSDPPSWMLPRPAGILVAGLAGRKHFLTALDPASGRRSWPRDLVPKVGAAIHFERDTVYLSNDGTFSRIPLATGRQDEIAPLHFEGGEQPTLIDTVEGGGFVLASRQNIMRVGKDGHVVYRRYYKAPGASFLAKLASTALMVGLNVASYYATPPGGLAPMATRNPVLSARYGRTTEAVNYFYIFTQTPDSTGREGYSLVLLDRRDGRELGRLWFDERSPSYTVDRVTGAVYEREGREVIARRLRAP